MHLQNAYNLEEHEIVSLEGIRVFTEIEEISLILLVYNHYADKLTKLVDCIIASKHSTSFINHRSI